MQLLKIECCLKCQPKEGMVHIKVMHFNPFEPYTKPPFKQTKSVDRASSQKYGIVIGKDIIENIKKC